MNNKITPIGYLMIGTLFILLGYAGWIYSQSIDWKVLDRLEDAPLSIPSLAPINNTSTPSATLSPKK